MPDTEPFVKREPGYLDDDEPRFDWRIWAGTILAWLIIIVAAFFFIAWITGELTS